MADDFFTPILPKAAPKAAPKSAPKSSKPKATTSSPPTGDSIRAERPKGKPKVDEDDYGALSEQRHQQIEEEMNDFFSKPIDLSIRSAMTTPPEPAPKFNDVRKQIQNVARSIEELKVDLKGNYTHPKYGSATKTIDGKLIFFENSEDGVTKTPIMFDGTGVPITDQDQFHPTALYAYEKGLKLNEDFSFTQEKTGQVYRLAFNGRLFGNGIASNGSKIKVKVTVKDKTTGKDKEEEVNLGTHFLQLYKGKVVETQDDSPFPWTEKLAEMKVHPIPDEVEGYFKPLSDSPYAGRKVYLQPTPGNNYEIFITGKPDGNGVLDKTTTLAYDSSTNKWSKTVGGKIRPSTLSFAKLITDPQYTLYTDEGKWKVAYLKDGAEKIMDGQLIVLSSGKLFLTDGKCKGKPLHPAGFFYLENEGSMQQFTPRFLENSSINPDVNLTPKDDAEIKSKTK